MVATGGPTSEDIRMPLAGPCHFLYVLAAFGADSAILTASRAAHVKMELQ